MKDKYLRSIGIVLLLDYQWPRKNIWSQDVNMKIHLMLQVSGWNWLNTISRLFFESRRELGTFWTCEDEPAFHLTLCNGRILPANFYTCNRASMRRLLCPRCTPTQPAASRKQRIIHRWSKQSSKSKQCRRWRSLLTDIRDQNHCHMINFTLTSELIDDSSTLKITNRSF